MHRPLEIGVGKDNVGRFAAKLECHALEVTGGALQDPSTDSW